ncbi:MAG: ATP-binding cassette domain-containing protein [Coriobacteriia bacterium]|nr:ATP-binding cassette domain-containing protein [Coriobacteriia bacterium]
MIRVEDLVKRYNGLTAVERVSFEVARGEVFGFLGPNGAGKTTTINVLCTLLGPTEGRASVGGHDVEREPDAVRRSIGLIFQDPTLDDMLTGMQNLRFHAMLYGLPRAVFAERSAELLDMVELADRARDNVKSYSGGMRRRLEIARGLLHRPRVLFLDEPTIGLDPQTRRHIWDYLRRVRDSEGLTLFLTTHTMEEAEICDRIAIIDQGRIIALDTPARLKSMVGGDVVTLSTSDNERAGRLLAERHGVEARPGPEDTIVVETEEGGRFIPTVLGSLGAEGLQVLSVNLARPTLEDVFLKLTGRTIREEEAGAREQLLMAGRMWRKGRQ